MAKERILNAASAVLLAVTISFGGIGCMVTGLEIEADLQLLLTVCLGVSLVWTAVCQFRWLPVILLAAAEAWLLGDWILDGSIVPALRDSLEVLTVHVTKIYDLAYRWGYIQWSEVLPQATPDLILGVLAGTVALLVSWVISQRRSAWWVLPAGLPLIFCLVVTNTVPATEYLMLYLAGIALLVLTHSLRRRDEAQGNRVTALLLIPALLMTCGLFWLTPKESYVQRENVFTQWFDGLTLQNQDVLQGSASEYVRLDKLGNRQNAEQTVLQVLSTASGRLYLRGRSYDSYDGFGWLATDVGSGMDYGWSVAAVENRGTVHITTVVPQEVYYFPSSVGTDMRQAKYEKGVLQNPEQEKSYTFYWGTTKEGGLMTDNARQAYLALPDMTMALAKRELTNWELPEATEALAQTVAEKVRDAAIYSLNPSQMPDTAEDFAMWFYQEASQGYCAHFATAATVLLRAAGVPARYVTGYVLDAQAGKEESVPARQAHAWVEYYDEKMGWVILEATPGYEQEIPDSQPTEPEETTAPTEPSEETTAPTEPEEGTTAPTTAPTQPSVSDSQPTTEPTQVIPPEQKEEGSARYLLWLVWILLSAAAIWGQYRLRLWLKRRYLRRGDANRQALVLWREVLRQSRILGKKAPKELRALAEKAKFSQHTLTEAELQEFYGQLAFLMQQLRKKPWLVQWMLRLIFAI